MRGAWRAFGGGARSDGVAGVSVRRRRGCARRAPRGPKGHTRRSRGGGKGAFEVTHYLFPELWVVSEGCALERRAEARARVFRICATP